MNTEEKINIGDFLVVKLNQDSETVFYKKIEESRYLKLSLAYQQLFELNYHLRRAIEVKLNIEELNNSLRKHLDVLNQKIHKHDYGEFILIDVNRIFTNILSSFKAFVDHFDAKIKKSYGEKSYQYKQVKIILSEYYDKYFNYRLIYELRNYSQHFNYVIQKVNFEQANIDGNSILKPYLDRDLLLKDERIRRKLGHELRMYNNLFPIDEIIFSLQNILEKLTDKLLLVDIEEKWSHVIEFKRIIDEIPEAFYLGFCKVDEPLSLKNSLNLMIIPQKITIDLFNLKNENSK